MLGIASALLAVSPVEASDRASATTTSSHRTKSCRKVTVAAMTKTNPPAPNASERASLFGDDFAAQHPSGGG
jgi:hypothetical protein